MRDQYTGNVSNVLEFVFLPSSVRQTINRECIASRMLDAAFAPSCARWIAPTSSASCNAPVA
ncbi:hypothetical protein [Gluconobacter cerinus]|uniref:hypothetical protein n=1 Tax=Gluconobacter cerinus TaxID=38307 RepID=UPI001B8D224D|nr:hypothetical protein [Gluconobacter cerinus]MBS1038939.1 hypothetical protein [Gluconobacter cerinus]